ncbi:MAG: DUF262 domain-containing protein [Balneola sp.]|nr:DUF262 domain-containing protein [Balneola sp.]MBO6652308.1 DUF262 domain-containing protein [Balneola sp.]MBO6710889.1 DUF262 domain-containing protein [Balneola sp.]MBO6799576.1 DUF262 domain-containing protein [Balneola sp.]MBO6870308.1 DUF262 domain-containing protein [Balneola sp.]
MAKVSLDALLPREDFDIDETQNSAKKKESFSISDLREDDFFYLTLRKPDFQRETNEWTPQKISELIKSFINGELIPAVILWRSKGGFNFVIDGSHRVSSLVAWINDDYGDGPITKESFNGSIPEEQIQIGERTRRLVEKEVGKYKDYQLALKFPERVSEEIQRKAKNLGSIAVQLQWVEGDADVAEASFFKINQQAAKIDPTELKLIKSRKKPNGIASRAIIKGGKGHQYWSKFKQDKVDNIEQLAEEINKSFFLPKLKNPVKTLDLPIGGKGYSSQSPLLIFEYVNMVNRISEIDDVEDDVDGEKTIEFLKKSKKISNLINSTHPSSLGLHPAVYFYSKGGRHKTASFFAVTELLMELERTKRFKQFTDCREIFEEILIDYDFVVQQILRHYRSSSKAIPHIKNFLLSLINELQSSSKNDAITNVLKLDEYKFIKGVDFDDSIITSKDFSDETKSAAFITEALSNAVRCKICNARMHTNSITIDHITRKEEGGIGNFGNAQLAHPYCNSTYKN